MSRVIGKTFLAKKGKNATQNPPKQNATTNVEPPKTGDSKAPVKEEK